jgi:hypothetical protein
MLRYSSPSRGGGGLSAEQVMTTVTDEQIAILCDIGQGSEIDVTKAWNVERLVADGMIELNCTALPGRYKLTNKGQQFISERDAGLNEA